MGSGSLPEEADLLNRSKTPLMLLGVATLLALAIAVSFRRESAMAADAPAVADKLAFQTTQPDYANWQSITAGMDEGDVIDKLGLPLAKPDGFDRNTDVAYTWEYGYVTPKSLVFPKPLMFRIWFQRGKVSSTEDPFNGVFSKDQTPTVPEPLWPRESLTFEHYPRWLDLRWYPASGQYPMRYEVEIGALHYDGNPDVPGGWNTKVIPCDIPYLAAEAEGMGRGRWRVRAINALKIGDWSDYRDFSFLR